MIQEQRLFAGRYVVGEVIGHGGMADVFEGTDTRLGRSVAIKILRSDLALDPAFRTRFRQEAQAASRMAHPTIVRVFDAGEEIEHNGAGDEVQVPFIVMERVVGQNLRDVIAAGPIAPEETVRIMQGVLTALEYSHRAGVVHRDVKPGNIMLTRTGQVKVMDFGIARAITDSAVTVAQTTSILGTAAYFSPEQARGETADSRTDIYSAGVLLFELLTGRPPFLGDSAVAVAYRHVSEKPPLPSSMRPEVSPALDAVVLHALAKKREDRYQTAAEFGSALDDALAGRMEEPDDPAPATAMFALPEEGLDLGLGFSSAPVVRTQNRPPAIWIWAAAATVVVIIVAVVIWLLGLSSLSLVPDVSRTVPTTTSYSYSSAEKALKDVNLVPKRVAEASGSVSSGKVTRTVPAAGQTVRSGSTVSVYVSTGPQTEVVPSVAGVSATKATKKLEKAGFSVGSISQQNSGTVPQGKVIRTDPAIGSDAVTSSDVDIAVSTGLVSLPDLEGRPLAKATKRLTKLGLVPATQPDYTCDQSKGLPVQWQSKAAGDVAQNSTVTIGYCLG